MPSPVSNNLRWLRVFSFAGSLHFYHSFRILYFLSVTDSYTLAASIFTLLMLTTAAAEVPTGVLSDRLGRKGTMMLGAACSLASLLLYAMSTSYPFLVLGALLAGIGLALYSGNNNALLYDTLHEAGTADDFAAHYGRLNALSSAGSVVSSVFGSLIAAVSFPAAAWLSVVPGVVALVASLRLVEPASSEARSGSVYTHLVDALRHVRRNRTLRLASLAGILEEGFGATAFQFQAALYAQVWPLWAIGLARAMGELVAGVGFRYSDVIIRRVGERHIILASSVYGWLANIAGALFPSVWTPLVISSSVLFYGPATIAEEALKQREFTQAQRATLASLNSFAASIVHGVIALGIGVVADQLGAARSLLVIELGFTSAILLTWQLWRVLRDRHKRAG